MMLPAFLVIYFSGLAQERLPCGNGKIDTAALNAALTYERSHQRQGVVDHLVRVYFHVFHDDDGTRPAATFAQINSEFASLLASYTADNVCFLFAGIDSTNSTNLNRNFNADTDPNGTALSSLQVPGCINIFYMQRIGGTNTACNPPCGYGGIALGGIPGTFFLVATGRIGSANTIGHEMGHSLGLLHTFETAFGFENINGSNAATTGDRITDTPADPYCYSGLPCYSTGTNGCVYTGTCPDPGGATNFTPPYTNLMSYWPCVPSPVASTGQFARVNTNLISNAPLINCSSPSSDVLTPVTVSSGYYMKSAINTLSTSGNVIINSLAIATLGGETVMLNPGFRASPAAGGKVLVRPKPCN